MPAPTILSPLGSFRLGSRLMQTAWTIWNGCDGLAASSARPVVIREDGGLGTAGSCVLHAGVIVLFVQNLAVISLRTASSKAFRLRVRYAKLDVASH